MQYDSPEEPETEDGLGGDIEDGVDDDSEKAIANVSFVQKTFVLDRIESSVECREKAGTHSVSAWM